MNAEEGRSQTTQGIWVSRSHKLEHCTLVLDLEGSDGRERGEDDTAFERQAALFALALADVLLVNIWCHDIGREAGAGKPLMKTILQVHLKLLQDVGKRTHLVFVIRDKSKKTPLVRQLAACGGACNFHQFFTPFVEDGNWGKMERVGGLIRADGTLCCAAGFIAECAEGGLAENMG
jgi:hypothetical protein